jgi:hypothetical protein
MTSARPQRAALGWSVHTGWAILVAVAGSGDAAAVVDRRRIELMPHRDAKRPRFVFHAAQTMARAAAERLVREATALSSKNAKAAIGAAIADLRAAGYDARASGIVVGNKRLEASLETILESHALIHTAEGQFFRDVIRDESRRAKLRVAEVPAKTLDAGAAQALRLSSAALAARLAAIGRAAGRPWSKDHRQACLAALIAIAG